MKKIIFIVSVLLFLVIGVQNSMDDSRSELPKKPIGYKRVLAISPALKEIVLDLLEPESIVAISDASRKSSNEIVAKKANKIKNKVSERPSTEEIINLKPDAILIPVVFTRAQADTLRDCGFNVIPLEVPEGYEAIKKRIMYIAKNLGVENKGKIVVEQMDSKMQSVRNRLKNIDGYKTVIGYSINGAFGRKNGSFDNICKEANAVNGAGLLNLQRGEHLSKEQIIKLDPDVIICSVSVRDSNMVEEILGDPAFTQIKAIQNKNVVVTEDRYMSSSTQYFVDAVDHISKLVYPEHNT